MSLPDDRLLHFTLWIPANHPQLLEGLEDLLRRNLIREDQVRQWCEMNLSIRVPTVQQAIQLTDLQQTVQQRDDFPDESLDGAIAPEIVSSRIPTVEAMTFPQTRFHEDLGGDVLQESAPAKVSASPHAVKGVGRLIQGLAEEISLRWLLFLGVFLVVVSSGVLAASQWNRFSPWAQYGVLLAYTTAFFSVGQICQKRSNLQLTTQTLQGVSLLLVPVNFWAMDGLNLWHSGMGWLTIVLSVPILLFLSRRLTGVEQSLWGFGLLSLLQWGWRIPLWPLIAVYGGVLATQFSSQFLGKGLPLRRRSKGDESARAEVVEEVPGTVDTVDYPEQEPLAFLGHWSLWYGLAILVLRAIFVAGVALPQLGLAIALTGWFLTHPIGSTKIGNPHPSPKKGEGEPDQSPSRPLGEGFRVRAVKSNGTTNSAETQSVPRVAEVLGMSLLVVGWFVTLATLPLQTIVISGMGLALWGERLGQQWRRQDWLTVVTIALQLGYQFWRIIPDVVQSTIVTWGTGFTYTEDYPLCLLSVAGFVYVFSFIIAAQWFQVRRQPQLVQLTDLLTIILTSILLTLSLVTAPLRTLAFGLATIASGLTLVRPPTGLQSGNMGGYTGNPRTVYLTHGLALLTLLFGMGWLNPDWTLLGWARFTLSLALLHWGSGLFVFPKGSRLYLGQRSGLVWATLFSLSSYALFFLSLPTIEPVHYHTLYWCTIPLALTGLGYWHHPDRFGLRFLKGGVLTICLLQGLTFWFPETRQLGLLYGLLNLFGISALVPRVGLAALTLGFGGVSSTLAIAPFVEGTTWFIYWTGVLNGLWIIDRGIEWGSRIPGFPSLWTNSTQPLTLAQVYQRALRRWGQTIALLLGLFFTCSALVLTIFDRNTTPLDIPIGVLFAVGLFALALLHRSYPWRTNRDFYTLAWAVELLLIHGLHSTQRPWLGAWTPYALLWAHLGLGLVTQQVGHWLRKRSGHNLVCFNLIPLIWAGLAGLSRWDLFTAWTGLITLGISWIALEVGRPKVFTSLDPSPEYLTKSTVDSGWQGWSYLGLGGITLGIAELLAYPLRSDLPTLLLAWAGLGVAMALLYRYGVAQMISASLRIPVSHLRQLAHLHWGASTGVMMLRFLTHLDGTSTTPALTLSVGGLLALYALVQARHNLSDDDAVMWTYGSYLHLSGILLYAWTIAPEVWQQGIQQWGLAIVAPLGLVLYRLPWQQWGWIASPWQQMGVGVPLLLAIVTLSTATSGSWLVTAISYGVLSYSTGKLRLSYLALFFLDATVWRWCIENDRSGVLWYSVPLAVSMFWITAIDPHLTDPDQREMRHNLRLEATLLLCGVPLLPGQGNPLLIIGLSLLSIFAGLALRTRAFLYGGTLIFLGYSFYQLVILVTQQSLLKWAIGLGLGILMIWTAATFETRRDQIRRILYNWADALADWD